MEEHTSNSAGPIRLAPDSLPEATPGYIHVMDWLVTRVDDLEEAMENMAEDCEALYDAAEILRELESMVEATDSGLDESQPLPEGAHHADPQTQDPATLYRVTIAGMRAMREPLETLLGCPLDEWTRPEPVVEDDGRPVPTPRRFGVQAWQNNHLQVGFVCFHEEDSGDQEALRRSSNLPISYVVHRRIGSGRWEFLCEMGMPFIRDASLPPGTKRVLYRVAAHRFGRFGYPGYVAVSLSPEGGCASCEESPRLALAGPRAG
ncbi:MAG: hypothetical protein RIB58_04025 [Phycisphaerales bacterium]